ncbi:MAG: hypothetical protein ACD_51C00092G0003 [uncultured bacterium]|nr:MAG: hypothetical protein ACD_51C00092G0003 [uncultured bacterium]
MHFRETSFLALLIGKEAMASINADAAIREVERRRLKHIHH